MFVPVYLRGASTNISAPVGGIICLNFTDHENIARGCSHDDWRFVGSHSGTFKTKRRGERTKKSGINQGKFGESARGNFTFFCTAKVLPAEENCGGKLTKRVLCVSLACF